MTCRSLPRPDHELPPLVAAFAARGIEASIECWDDDGVDWNRFDAAILRSTWNYVQSFERFVPWLDRIAGACRLVNDHATVRWNLHKGYLLELARRGAAIVPTEVLPAGAAADWPALFARWGDLVVKPAVSAGSFQTLRVPAGDVAAATSHRHANLGRDMLIQPLLASVVECGERNLVYFDGRFSHAVHKAARWKGDPEASGGTILPDADESRLAERVLDIVGEIGVPAPAYARVDVARGRDGAAVLMELELIEPSLFIERVPEAPDRLVQAVLASVARPRQAAGTKPSRS